MNQDINHLLNRPNWDQYFIKIAEVVAIRSHDAETQVGAVIIDKSNKILSTGYNGFPVGCEDDNLPNLRPDKYPYIIHSELNAIIAARQDLKDSTIYVTLRPCKECAKAILAAGIKKVVYKEDHEKDDSHFVFTFLKNSNIEVCKIS